MSWRRILQGDAAISLILHGLKVAVVLGINWLALNSFPVDAFVVWSVTASILMVATASDLGIGQYTVTGLVHRERPEWSGFVATSVLAMVPLSLAGGLFVFIALDGGGQGYALIMAAMLVLRVITIPYGAVLNAANQFKQRKAIECIAYLAAAVGIAWVGYSDHPVRLALLMLNASFVLAALLTVAAAARYAALRPPRQPGRPAAAARLFGAALPFTANNLSGLLTYGAFVWLCSLVLPAPDVAKLAVLHGFVLVTAWQLYEVFLKARQADLADPARLPFYRRANWVVMLAAPVGFVLTGPYLLPLLGPVRFEIAEIALFALFMAFELANLYLQSRAQISLDRSRALARYAFWRLGLLLAFAATATFDAGPEARVEALLVMLAAGSALTSLALINDGKLGRKRTALHSRPSGTTP